MSLKLMYKNSDEVKNVIWRSCELDMYKEIIRLRLNKCNSSVLIRFKLIKYYNRQFFQRL